MECLTGRDRAFFIRLLKRTDYAIETPLPLSQANSQSSPINHRNASGPGNRHGVRDFESGLDYPYFVGDFGFDEELNLGSDTFGGVDDCAGQFGEFGGTDWIGTGNEDTVAGDEHAFANPISTMGLGALPFCDNTAFPSEIDWATGTNEHSSLNQYTIPTPTNAITPGRHNLQHLSPNPSILPLPPPLSSTTTPSSRTSPPSNTSPNPSSSSISNSRIAKRTKNTLAARRYRQKKIDEMATLEQILEEMRRERDALKERVARLEGEREVLRGLVGKGG
ncbi:hypothetical protein B7494_g8237 [Chlorociboria aeruginascens]|nr:hypothetical protein B7494_g8237 [Chlorociboria aeruginascens]